MDVTQAGGEAERTGDARYGIKRVFVERAALSFPAAEKVRRFFPPETITVYEGAPPVPPGGKVKENLVVAVPRGDLFKPCPCTSVYTGCGYTVLNYVHNCPLTCTYCILQAYCNEPAIVLYPDFGRMERELEEKMWRREEERRVGTGELGDSLALEHLCGVSRFLVESFARRRCGVLELKTKTARVEGILDAEHGGRTVVGWSLNAPFITRNEERDTAPLEERLRAAVRARDAGYLVSFHVDPVIHHPGWERGYGDMLEMVGDILETGERIAWVSIGGMRFMPRLKAVIDARFPRSIAAAGEFVEGLDGKKRYYVKTRVTMFREIYRKITRMFPAVPVYLCMESEKVWRAVAGFHPGPTGLKKMLDEAVGIA